MELPNAPEAVSAPQYSGFWIRLLAYIIDAFILGAVNNLMAKALAAMAIGEPANFIVIFAISWMYFAIFESSGWMGTPGKKLLGMTVTDEQGRRITVARAACRYIIKVPLLFLPAVILIGGYFAVRMIAAGNWNVQLLGALLAVFLGVGGVSMIAFTTRKQGLHDKMFHTLVLQKTARQAA